MIKFNQLPLAELLNWLRSKMFITRDMVLPGSIPLTGLDPSTGTIPATAVPGTARGLLGYAQVTANQTISTGTETDLTGLSIAVTVGTNRWIMIYAQGILSRSVADGVTIGNIKEGSTALQRWCQHSPSATTEFDFATGWHIFNTTPGIHTYKLTLQRFTGTGNVVLNAAAGSVASIAVFDIGSTV